ncbi:hypothetical protein HanIR_Chr04g0150961 [Helianthus annuus]|nr:hypothetical protein HanIR_Chr04g0150961 [Helianthus annuus]
MSYLSYKIMLFCHFLQRQNSHFFFILFKAFIKGTSQTIHPSTTGHYQRQEPPSSPPNHLHSTTTTTGLHPDLTTKHQPSPTFTTIPHYYTIAFCHHPPTTEEHHHLHSPPSFTHSPPRLLPLATYLSATIIFVAKPAPPLSTPVTHSIIGHLLRSLPTIIFRAGS